MQYCIKLELFVEIMLDNVNEFMMMDFGLYRLVQVNFFFFVDVFFFLQRRFVDIIKYRDKLNFEMEMY